MRKVIVKKKQCQYEYVASALNFAGTWEHDYVNRELIGSWFAKVSGLHNHYLSILFNAYTEEDKATVHSTTKGPHRVYSDSGGLQMVSLGIGKITDELKQKVYEIQGKHSDVAMIFDEIPIFVPEYQQILNNVSKAVLKKNNINTRGSKELNRTGSRFYDPTLLKPCAIATATNMLNQIKTFEKMGVDTKTICILQGNSTKDYQQWFDYILEVLPKPEWERISGIAFGSPVYGGGLMEDIERSFFIHKFEAPDYIKKHFHLLGVGSTSRMLPNVIFRRTGIIPADTLISYDSSKHTGGTIRGQYQIDFDMIQIARETKKNMDKIDHAVISFAHHILKEDIDRDILHDVILLSKQQIYDKHGGDGPKTRELFVQYRFIMLLFSVYQASKALDRCHTDDKYLQANCENDAIMGLHQVKTQSDFDKWKIHAKSQVGSKKTPCKDSVTSLDSFFGD